MLISKLIGQKHIQRGLTILEVLLILTLTVVVGAGFFATYKQKQKKQLAGDCAQSRWRWVGLAAEIESELRRWEMLAPLCLQAGFSPLEVSQDGKKIRLHRLITSRPLAKNMRYPAQLTIPYPHEFATRGNLLLCDKNGTRHASIRRISNNRELERTVLRLHEKTSRGKRLLERGSLAASLASQEYLVRPDRGGKYNDLYLRSGPKAERLLLRRLTSVAMRSEKQDSPPSLEITFDFFRPGCQYSRSFAIKSETLASSLGTWYVGERELNITPWPVISQEGGRR